MSEIEDELLMIVNLRKPAAAYEERQDYLAAVTRAVDKLHEDRYDVLSDEAVAWFRAAVDAMNDKDPIHDFPDLVEEEDDTSDATESDYPADEAEAEGEVVGDEPATAPAEDESDLEGVEDSRPVRLSDNGEAPHPTPAVVPDEAAVALKPVVPTKPTKPRKPKPVPTGYEHLTGEKDRYGIIMGTKTSAAAKMYEKGCTVKEIEDKIGGRHRNILKKLALDGHRVEKLPNGVFRLTHKDDRGK